MIQDLDNLSLTQDAVISRVNGVLKKLDREDLKLESEGCCSPLTILYLYHGIDWLKDKLKELYLIGDKYDKDSQNIDIKNITDQEKSSILDFAETMTKLHDIHKHYPGLQQQDVSKMKEHLLAYPSDNILTEKFSISFVANREELEEILAKLIIDKGDISLYIGDIYHCVGLIVNNNKYFFYDSNNQKYNSVGIEAKNISQLCDYLYGTRFCTKTIYEKTDDDELENYNEDDKEVCHTYIGISIDIFSKINNEIKYDFENVSFLDKNLNHDVPFEKRKARGSNSLLHLASYNGHTELVKYIINKYSTIDMQNDEGQTSLILSAGRGHFDIVKLLVENNADIELMPENQKNVLIKSVASGNVELVKYLLEELEKRNLASSFINERVIVGKIESDEDSGEEESNDSEEEKLNIQENPCKFITHYTLKRHYIGIFNVLLNNQFDIKMVDENKQTVLHHVLNTKNFYGFVDSLLAHPEINTVINNNDSYGRKPIDIAISTCKPLVYIKMLVKHGAVINEKTIKCAKELGDEELCNFLQNPDIPPPPKRKNLQVKDLLNSDSIEPTKEIASELVNIFKRT